MKWRENRKNRILNILFLFFLVVKKWIDSDSHSANRVHVIFIFYFWFHRRQADRQIALHLVLYFNKFLLVRVCVCACVWNSLGSVCLR